MNLQREACEDGAALHIDQIREESLRCSSVMWGFVFKIKKYKQSPQMLDYQIHRCTVDRTWFKCRILPVLWQLRL